MNINEFTAGQLKHLSNNYLLGAVAGDIIGSVYEFHNVKTMDFPLFGSGNDFTDDSVLTFATMDAILNRLDYVNVYQSYARKWTGRGYGGNFYDWIYRDNPQPYNSYGNGSAMRVSPVGWACCSLDEVLAEAKRSAEVTHNHPEGIKGAQATAVAVFMARSGATKAEIKTYIADTFNYDLNRTTDEIRPTYHFNESCQGTVPEAIIAFLESNDFEHAIRLAVSLGGDSDTLACITGGIAEAFYRKIPDEIVENVLKILPKELIALTKKFAAKFCQTPNNRA